MGKEFYTTYAEHIYTAGAINTNTSNASYMVLYITSDKNATVKVEIMDGSFSQQYNVVANQATQVAINPTASLKGISGVKSKAAIHITSDNDISVYTHLYGLTTVGISGATMLLPVNVLGKDYRSVNFTQVSNSVAFGEGKSYSFLNVIATEDNTSVEITPTSAVYNSNLTTTKPAGTPYIITLPNKGDVYQALADNDLTGTRVKAISVNSSQCNPVAVFSGSSKISIGYQIASCAAFSTADNLFQQVYPTAAWGTLFTTVPLTGRESTKDIYRVVVSDPSTVIKGVPAYQQTDLAKGYIEFVADQPMVISADKPIQVVQYAISQFAVSCRNNTGDLGDPEMIFLNPVEQAVSKASFYSAGRFQVTKSYVNVVLPTDAISSFKLDGNALPAGISFTPMAGNANFSYAQIPVSNGPQATSLNAADNGAHYITANKPFNAVAYGFGNDESYGYSAGASFTVLNESLVLKDPVTNATPTNGCSNKGYTAQLTLPYRVSQITWKTDDGFTYVQNNPTATVSQVYDENVYTYSYLNADKNTNLVYFNGGNRTLTASVPNPITGCGTDDNQASISISDSPVPVFSATGACVGEPYTFSVSTPANAGNIISQTWDFGDNTSSNTLNTTHTYAAAGSYNVKLTINYNGGCSATSESKVVKVTNKPVAAFTYSSPDCASKEIAFTDKTDAAGSTITTRLWEFGDNTTSPLQNPTHTYANPGQYTVKLTVTNDNVCQGTTISQTIIVNPVPAVTIAQPTPICREAAPVTIIANTNGAAGVGVFSGDGISPAGVFDPARVSPGIHAINYIFTASSGCTYSQSINIEVYATPTTPQFTYTGVCGDGATVFTMTQPSATANINSYSWDFGDGTIINGGQSISHQFSGPGNYKVVLVTKYANGCMAVSDPQMVHINKKPAAMFTYSSPNCSGVQISFKDASNDPEGAAIASWAWDFGDGVTSTNANPTHTYFTPGNYPVSLIVTTPAGCQSIAATQTVVVSPVPVINITQPKPLCMEEKSVTIAVNTNGATGKGIFSGDGISSAGVFNPYRAGAGTHVINYIFTSQSGCTYTQSFSIVVYPTPDVSVGNDVTLLEGDSTILSASVSTQGMKYKWYPSAGLNRDDVLNPVARPLNDTKYTLTVTSASGCTNFANISVQVLKTPKVMNAFTPNGDGINDLWKIDLLDSYPQALINIYTRNGEKVFSSVGYSVPWDGKYNGTELPTGVYYYIVNLKNGRKPITGNVTIIR